MDKREISGYGYLVTSSTYISKLSRDMVIPLLPLLAEQYAVSTALSQRTVGIYFLGIAAARLTWTSVADRCNPRQVLLLLHALFIIACLLCFQAMSFEGFLLGRFLQAFSIAGVPLITRAVIFHSQGSHGSTKLYGFFSVFSAWAPAVATTLGAALATYFGTESVFLLLMATAVINAIVVYGLLTYTSLAQVLKDTQAPKQTPVVQVYLQLICTDRFWALAVPFGLLTANNALYMAMSPYLLLGKDKLSLQAFGLTYFLLMAGSVAGRTVTAILIDRYTTGKLLLLAPLTACIASLVGLFISKELQLETWAPLLVMTVIYASIGASANITKSHVGVMAPKSVATALGFLTTLESVLSFVLAFGITLLAPQWDYCFVAMLMTSFIAFLIRLRI